MSARIKAIILAVVCAAAALAASDLRLVRAVRAGNVEEVRALLKQKLDVNAAQGDGATALHWAARLDNLAMADLLIRAGARVNAANDDGATALYLACVNRSAAMVERLLAAGADTNSTLQNGETALMTCSRTGDANTVKALLVKGAAVNAKESAHNQTALMWAVSQRHPAAAAMLLEFGADFRARSLAYPQTVVGEQTQRAGREELNYTVMRGGSTPLLFAARVGDVESAKLLHAKGADVNDALPDGTTALILAAYSGQGPVAETLLDKGANPNNTDIGYSALHAAVLRSDIHLVKALLAHGADPNIRMTKGTPMRRDTTDFNLPQTLIGATPMLLAAKFLEPEIIKALVTGGADMKLTMRNGATPLMLAAGMGSGLNQSRRGIARVDFGKVEPESRVLEGVKAVLNFTVDINAGSETGDTALHSATQNGYDSVVQYLADKGANVNVKNKRGVTPLALALNGGGRGGRRGAGAGAAGGRGAVAGGAVAGGAAVGAAVAGGAGGGADLGGADDTGVRRAPVSRQSTAALLRKLGATE